LVKEERTIKVTCWASQCEDFCVPGPSKRGCKRNVEHVDCTKGKCGTCNSKKAVWFNWCPSRAHVSTKKKLMKKTIEKKVCGGYKWVVEDLCGGCETKFEAEAPALDPETELPEPPALDARVLHGKRVIDKTVSLSR